MLHVFGDCMCLFLGGLCHTSLCCCRVLLRWDCLELLHASFLLLLVDYDKLVSLLSQVDLHRMVMKTCIFS